MNRRLISMLLALGLVLSVFAGVIGPAAADHTDPELDESHVYLPWVPNGAELDGLGPFYGAVTVQNLEDQRAFIHAYVGSGNGFSESAVLALEANASTTLSAEDLGVSDGGTSVFLEGWLNLSPQDLSEIYAEVAVDEGVLSAVAEDEAVDLALGVDAALDEALDAWVDAGILDEDAVNDLTDTIEEVLDEIAEPARIAASTKQASPEPSPNARTGPEHEIVDGYTGMSGDEVAADQHVVPIAQTNNNWNTIIRVANFGDTSTPVTVTFYESGGQGAAGESAGQFTETINAGEVAEFDLVELGFADEDMVDDPETDWVGTAFISANQPIGAVAERVKAETDMLIMNVSQPMGLDFPDFQAAPLIFQEYNFWNTGISVANLSETEHNTVTITYYGPTSNVVGQDQVTIPPRGMEYVYTPGTQDLGLGGVGQEGFVGSAVIEGTSWFHASVDEVKYFGGDEEVGHAMSYVAEWDFATGDEFDEETGELFTGDMLALPLVQKGSTDGDGDTSGIQLFNVHPEESVGAHVWFVDSTGELVAPTLDNPISVDLAAHENYTLYAHDYSEMPEGFQGSAIVSVAGDGALVGVSNNVNYSVQQDGSAAYNLVSVPGEVVGMDIDIAPEAAVNLLADPEDPEADPAAHDVTVTVTDPFGDPVEGEDVNIRVAGANVEPTTTETTDAAGQIVYSYTGNIAGDDTIIAWIGDDPMAPGDVSATASKTWIDFQELSVTLTPVSDSNLVGDEHTVIAAVQLDGEDVGEGDANVAFEITEGPHAGEFGIEGETNQDGQVSFSYTGNEVGLDTIQTTATLDLEDGVTLDATATAEKQWVEFFATLALAQDEAMNEVGTGHEFTATLTDVDSGDPADFEEGDVDVSIERDGGAVEPGDLDVSVTDNVATISYTGPDSGAVDTLNASVFVDGVEVVGEPTLTKAWCDATVVDGGNIQDAVDGAEAGDVICVEAGTYEEDVTIDTSLSLIGAQVGVDARDRENLDESEIVGSIDVTDAAGEVTIDGFTLTGTGSLPLAGVNLRVASAESTVRNNIVNAVEATGGYTDAGFFSFNSIENTLVEQNTFSGALDLASNPNVIMVNQASGIVTIQDNEMQDVGGGGGIGLIGDINTVNVLDNFIDNTGNEGMYHFGGTLSELNVTGNTFTNNDQNGILLVEGATSSSIHFNNIVDNTVFGLNNQGSDPVNATDNWWGHESGPFHPTENPDGQGDEVSDNVDFDPWLTEPATD